MKLGSIILLLALVTAPACGGGGGSSDSGTGGSPGPVAASFVPDQASPGANTVAMAQGAHSNDVVNVYVTLTDTNGVYGAAFEVLFDETHVTYQGYTHGAAFEQGNTPNYNVDGTTNPGRIVIGIARTNGTPTNIVGSKAMITLQFKVKQAGTFPVQLQNGVIYDAQSVPQPIAGISWFAGALQGS